MDNADWEPKRIELDYSHWAELPGDEKEAFFTECDQEMKKNGVLILANVIPEDQCDKYVRLIQHEIDTAAPIEVKVNELCLKSKGYCVYNLQSRQPEFLQLMSNPPVVEYFRRILGADMKLYNSEGRIIPPGSGDTQYHYDGFDRIRNYCLSMNSLYYLAEASATSGSTVIIPGTHKAFLPVAEAENREPKFLNVKKGDVVLIHPYLIYAASTNDSKEALPVITNYYVRSYMRQRFDYPGMISHVEAKKLTTEQRTLLGFNHRPTNDIHELYRFVGFLKKDYDPYGY